MISRRSKVRWATATAAIIVLAIAGFLIGRHDAGGGAQARPNPPRYEPEEAGSGGRPSASDSDAIHAAELVGPEEGWARTSSRLAWTTDGGASWSTITPPGIAPDLILAVRFDGSGDGVVVACRDINAVPVPLEFFRTTDDGQTWQVGTFEAEGPGSIGSVRMSEAEGSWWVLVDEAGVSSTGQRLYRSEDSGMTWQEALPRPPASGPFVFLSPQEGWIVGEQGTAGKVFRTVDAGASWEEIEAPLPGSTEAEEHAVPGPEEEDQTKEREEEPLPEHEEGDQREVKYGLPERGPEGVLLPVTVTSPAGQSEVLVYERSDDGSWKVVSTTEVSRTVASSEAATTFVAPGELLIQEPSATATPGPPVVSKVSTLSGGAGSSPAGDEALTTGKARAAGLPEPLPLHFLDRSHGVAVQTEVCRTSGCSNETQLFMTSDGGRSWSPPPTRP